MGGEIYINCDWCNGQVLTGHEFVLGDYIFCSDECLGKAEDEI